LVKKKLAVVAVVVNKGIAVVATNVESVIDVAAFIGIVVNVKVAVKGAVVVVVKDLLLLPLTLTYEWVH
jgi:hypothetical protein